MTIRASLNDIPLLSGYLHDATFSASDIYMDQDKQLFALEMERICYEACKKRRFLFLIPVKRYPYVKTRLSITNVQSMSKECLDKSFDKQEDEHLLLDIEQKEDATIEISSEHLASSEHLLLKVSASKESVLFVEDVESPSLKLRVTDLGKGVFRELDLIEALKK